MQRKEHDPARDAGQRAALCRLRRAQLAAARRIRQVVADACLLTPAHLCSRRRPAPLAEARQVAMYLMRTRLTWPTPGRDVAFPSERIGRLLGHRDHSTVLHGPAVIRGAAGQRPTGGRLSAPQGPVYRRGARRHRRG